MCLAGFTITFQQHTMAGIATTSQIALVQISVAMGSPIGVAQKCLFLKTVLDDYMKN